MSCGCANHHARTLPEAWLQSGRGGRIGWAAASVVIAVVLFRACKKCRGFCKVS